MAQQSSPNRHDFEAHVSLTTPLLLCIGRGEHLTALDEALARTSRALREDILRKASELAAK